MEWIEVSETRKGGPGAYGKAWYRAKACRDDGNYGLGFGASPETASRRAVKDLARDGGRLPSVSNAAVAVAGAALRAGADCVVAKPVSGKRMVALDVSGRPVCRDKVGRKYVLRGKCWVRCSG